MTSCLLSCASNSFEKGSSLKGKNLLPMGANSFLFEKTPIQKGHKNNFYIVISLESVSIPLVHILSFYQFYHWI